MMNYRLDIEFKELFEAIPAAVLLVDVAGNVLGFNRNARVLFGFDSVASSDVKLFQLQPHRLDQVDMGSNAMEGFRSLSIPVEIIFQRNGGGHFPGSVKSQVYTQNDGVEIFVLVIENVTSQKMKEGSRIRDKIEADKANDAKSDFLSSMSHEIRTPIQGTLGALDLLEQTDLCEQQLHYLNLAKNSSSSLLGIVNDVLDVASLDANAMRLNKIQIDLYQVLDEIYAIYRVYAYEKNSDITLRIDSSVPRSLNADPVRLRQVLCNYISNAIKYSNQGEINVHVRCDGDKKIVFEVNDNGPGVDQAIESTLFTQHVMGRNRDPKYGSYGIGLSVCKKLAALMGGSVGYTRRQPKGACFWFKVDFQSPHEAHVISALQKSNHKSMAHNGSVHKDNSILPVDEARMLSGKKADNVKQAIIFSDDPIKSMLEHQLSEWSVSVGNSGAALPSREQVLGLFTSGTKILLIFDSNSFPKAKILKYINGLINFFQEGELIEQSVMFLVFGLSPGEIASQCSANIEIEATADAYSLSLLARCCGDDAVINDHGTGSTVKNIHKVPLSLKGRYVLIAEDSETNLEIFTLQLESVGAKVAAAKDGLEAFNQYLEYDVDIVMLDLQMPKLGGFEIIKKIIESEKYRLSPKSIPIIAMSANVIGSIKQQCLSAGFNDYLMKPVRREAFLKSVVKWIDAGSADTETEAALPAAVTLPAPTALPTPIATHNSMQPDNNNAKSNTPLKEVEVVDFEFLEDQLSQVRPEAGLRMIELFIAEVSNRIILICDAIEIDDYHVLENEAHVLKSSCASFGAEGMNQLASSLEIDSKDRKRQQCFEACGKMKVMFEKTSTQLRDYVATHSGSAS